MKDENSIKITFGACKNHKKREAAIFQAIGKEDSDVFIWSGDVLYVDYNILPFLWGYFDPNRTRLVE